MQVKPVYTLDGDDLGVSVVFSDESVDASGKESRQLLAVRLAYDGWFGPNGNGYVNSSGDLSINAVVFEAMANKLRLNTEFIQSIK